MSRSTIAAICIFTVLVSRIECTNSFLRAGQVNETDLESQLLSELASFMRPSADNTRLQTLEGDLYQIFNAVPKENGTANHHVVRYVLHRHFVAKHGWFIRGLEPDGDHRDDSTEESHAMTDLQEWVPSYLQRFLEQLNTNKGLSLREVAVLAATLEDLIHKEAVERLELAWRALGFSQDQELYSSQVKKVMETFMVIYDSGGKFDAEGPAEVQERLNFYAKHAKDWLQTQAWLRRVRIEVFPDSGGASKFNFSQVVRLVEEVGERFARDVNDQDCSKLKGELLGVESSKRIGRVRLSDFYKKGLHSHWQFNEKKEYLRTLGALDESDPAQPYIIVSNYVASRPNCLVCSNFYVVCCRNECEDLMAQIEAGATSHLVPPGQLLRMIASLTSSTVRSPRKLSDAIMDKLREVAVVNGGKVPIHGRLFAQWMHHAFPRECPYPHEAGTTSPQTPDEWMASSGSSTHRASNAEMREHMIDEAARRFEGGDEDHELPWTYEEELLTKRPVVKLRPWRAILRKLAFFGAAGTMMTMAMLYWRSIWGEDSRKVHYA